MRQQSNNLNSALLLNIQTAVITGIVTSDLRVIEQPPPLPSEEDSTRVLFTLSWDNFENQIPKIGISSRVGNNFHTMFCSILFV